MFEREDQRYSAAVGLVISDGQETVPCMTRNLSRKGLFAVTKQRWAKESVLSLQLIHDGHRLNLEGRVAYIDETGIGFAFVDPTGTAEAKMTNLIHTLLATEPKAEQGEAVALWELPQDDGGGLWNRLTQRRKKARIIDLSPDGIALATKNPPELQTKIAVYLAPNPKYPDALVDAMAVVVRHTEHGFAAKLEAPTREFRQAVTEIRKACW